MFTTFGTDFHNRCYDWPEIRRGPPVAIVRRHVRKLGQIGTVSGGRGSR